MLEEGSTAEDEGPSTEGPHMGGRLCGAPWGSAILKPPNPTKETIKLKHSSVVPKVETSSELPASVGPVH